MKGTERAKTSTMTVHSSPLPTSFPNRLPNSFSSMSRVSAATAKAKGASRERRT